MHTSRCTGQGETGSPTCGLGLDRSRRCDVRVVVLDDAVRRAVLPGPNAPVPVGDLLPGQPERSSTARIPRQKLTRRRSYRPSGCSIGQIGQAAVPLQPCSGSTPSERQNPDRARSLRSDPLVGPRRRAGADPVQDGASRRGLPRPTRCSGVARRSVPPVRPWSWRGLASWSTWAVRQPAVGCVATAYCQGQSSASRWNSAPSAPDPAVDHRFRSTVRQLCECAGPTSCRCSCP